MDEKKDEVIDVLKSLPDEELDKLPKLTDEEIRKALLAGRVERRKVESHFGGGSRTLKVFK